jgi:hypothetical protein
MGEKDIGGTMLKLVLFKMEMLFQCRLRTTESLHEGQGSIIVHAPRFGNIKHSTSIFPFELQFQVPTHINEILDSSAAFSPFLAPFPPYPHPPLIYQIPAAPKM